jgi:hypothetical protein
MDGHAEVVEAPDAAVATSNLEKARRVSMRNLLWHDGMS